MGNAGYVALAVVLTAVITVALMPVLGNAPVINRFVPKATVRSTSTVTRSVTVTSTSTATSVVTQRFTETATVTRVRTTTATTTAWRTATETTTETETETSTITETVTATKTVTKTVVVSDFQYLNSPDKVIQLVGHANKTLIVFIPYANWYIATVWEVFSPTVGKILNATLQAYEQRKVDAYVVVAYDPICTYCKTNVKDTFIQYLNRLNATLPPKHVLETTSQDSIVFYMYPFKSNFLAMVLIDGKYMALIEPGLHPPTNDTRHTILLYDPTYITPRMKLLIDSYQTFDNPSSKYYWFYKDGILWVWDGCKSHGSPYG